MRHKPSADVLVVDDEADIRDLVAGILEDEGYRVRTAPDSEAALAVVRARKPVTATDDSICCGVDACCTAHEQAVEPDTTVGEAKAASGCGCVSS